MALLIDIDKQLAVLGEKLRHRNHLKRKYPKLEPFVLGFTLLEELSHRETIDNSYRQYV